MMLFLMRVYVCMCGHALVSVCLLWVPLHGGTHRLGSYTP